MKDGIIIQARTGSTRLHNKILLPFYPQSELGPAFRDPLPLAGWHPSVPAIVARV